MTPEMMKQAARKASDDFAKASLTESLLDRAIRHKIADAVALALLSAGTWQPIETVPAGVMRVILFWPAHTLDDDGNLSSGRIPANDVVAVGYKTRLPTLFWPSGQWRSQSRPFSASDERRS